MAIRPYLILLVSYTAGSTLTDDCPDAHAYDMEDIGWFHWKVLGVEGKNLTEQRERFVDVLLQGFDCERQIENMRCHGGSKVNVSCQQVRQRILANPKNSSTLVHNNRIAVRALIYGIDMQHVLCNTHKPPGLPPPNNERGCPPVDPSFLHYSGHWLFEYKLASKWKPKLMRHLVWRGCPENVAFVNRRQCYHLSSRTALMSLICSSRIMGVISHLIQGNRIVSESHQSCDIKYAEDIFRTFGNARGPSNNWTMDKYGLSSILQNLSSPYPPLPVTNKTSHFPNYHQFNWGHVAPWGNIPRPNNHIPGGHGGDETPPNPEYWIHNEPGPGEGTQSNTELNIIQTSHQKPWHGNRIPSPTDQNIKQESHTRPSNGVMTTSPTRVSSGQLLDSDRMNGSVKDISQIQGHTIEHGEGNKQHYLHTSEQSANGVSETRGKTGVKQLHMSVKQKSRRDVLNFPFPPDGLESNTRRFPRPSFNPTNTQASDVCNGATSEEI